MKLFDEEGLKVSFVYGFHKIILWRLGLCKEREREKKKKKRRTLHRS